MRFRLLGPLRVWDGATLLPIRAAQQRVVLSVLLIETGQVVSLDRLVDEVWGERPPRGAVTVLRGYVMRLRRMLGGNGHGSVLTRPGGYELVTADDDVDALVFQRLVASGRSALSKGAGDRAVAELSQALVLWRGHALADVPTSPTIAGYVTGLEQARLAALEDKVDGQLSLGRYGDVVAEVERLVNLHPLRERLWEHLVLALYRSGRRAEALGAYQRARAVLTTELGLEPGNRLQELQQDILAGNDQPSGKTTFSGVTPATKSVVPRQLPADTTAFTGRLKELRELDAVSQTSGPPLNAAVITGAAGIGKTALAIHWAHRVADQFPDGQLYLDLRGYHPDHPMTATEGLAAFLTALGLAGQHIPLEENERAARYRTEIAGQRMVIVLDNAATVEQVRPLLPGTGTSTVLVTSRDSLAGIVARDGARRLTLDLLPRADAHALLNRLIGPQAEAEPDAVTTLAELCDRLPLALRVAAELATSRPTTTLRALSAELADQQQRLEALDGGGDPRTAITTVFSWSIHHLPPDVARTFRLLGLHPGPNFDGFATAALADVGLASARRILDLLARAHLVHSTVSGRYGMHDLLRAYAADRATAEDIDHREAQGRLFDYYLATATVAMDSLYPAESHRRPRIPSPGTPGPNLADLDAARGWLDTERYTLLAVAAHSATHAMDMSATLWRYLDGGHHIDAVGLHTCAYDAARQVGDPAGQAIALHGLGTAYTWLSQYPSASQHLHEALSLFRQVGDEGGELRAHASLGIIAGLMDRHEPAAEHFAQALTLSRRIGDHTGEAKALLNLGVIDTKASRHEAAIDHLERALNLFQRDGNRVGIANSLDSLGLVEQRLGRHQAAARHLEEALALFRELGAQQGEARTLDNLGIVYLRLGHTEQAAAHLQAALTLFREVGDQEGQIWALNGLGETSHAVGDPRHALDHHAAALAIAVEIGVLDQQARAYTGLGHAQRALNNPSQARDHYERALALYTGLGAAEAQDIHHHLATLRPATHHP